MNTIMLNQIPVSMMRAKYLFSQEVIKEALLLFVTWAWFATQQLNLKLHGFQKLL